MSHDAAKRTNTEDPLSLRVADAIPEVASPWYNPGELIEAGVQAIDRGDTPERHVHKEVLNFIEAKESLDPDESRPDESLEDFLRFMLDEYERAGHFFARCQIAATYALAQAERAILEA